MSESQQTAVAALTLAAVDSNLRTEDGQVSLPKLAFLGIPG